MIDLEWIAINKSLIQIDSGKQSAYKFLEVLGGLRDWEVCSPDISAAIEFCRERIVDMNIEEYEVGIPIDKKNIFQNTY